METHRQYIPTELYISTTLHSVPVQKVVFSVVTTARTILSTFLAVDTYEQVYHRHIAWIVEYKSTPTCVGWCL